MKNAVRLKFLCLVLLAGCELWNQPIISKIEDKLNELRTIHTIFVSAPPSPKAFVAGKDKIPQNAAAWEACGLRVSGTNSLDETRVLTPEEEYTVDLAEVEEKLADVIDNKKTKMVAVTVRLKDSEVTTSFDITLLRPDEEYYWIEMYTDPDDKGKVSADPSLITGTQFDEAAAAGEEGVPVSIIVAPKNGYKLKDGSLAYHHPDSLGILLRSGGEHTFKSGDFGSPKKEKEYRIYLYAEFERADGVVMLNSKYYATLKEAIDAVEGSEDPIEVVTGFTIRDAVEIPDGKEITLQSASSEVKTITGNITIADGGKLRVKTFGEASDLNITGTITVKGGAVLDLAGAVSVNEVVLGNNPITVSGALFPSGGIAVKEIIAGEKKAGDPVLIGGGDPPHLLQEYDCEKFIVKGGQWVIVPYGDEGKLVPAAASRQVNGNEKYYTSIHEAVTASNGTSSTSPDTITVLASHEISDANKVTIPDGKHIRLVPKTGGSEITLTRAAGSASFTGNLFVVENGASLTLLGGLTIDGGNRAGTDHALINVEGGTLTMDAGAVLKNNKNGSGNLGGGVYLDGGTFNMYDGEISGNTAGYGGGVYVNVGVFNMSGGAISGNTAGYGGGVYVNGGVFNMYGGTIGGSAANSGNTASSGGGGVYVKEGAFTMSGGTIGGSDLASGNKANNGGGNDCGGGGVYVEIGTFTLSGGAISNNTASSSSGDYCGGGGVYVASGTFTLSGGAINDNNVNSSGNNCGGGGVYVASGTFTLSGGAISSNSADNVNSSGDYCGGGGVYVASGTFTLSGGAISSNNANSGGGGDRGGGGVYVKTGEFTMSGGTIGGSDATSGNKAHTGGGGVCIYNASFNMTGGLISNNKNYAVWGNGGGIYMNEDSVFTFSGGEISYNTCTGSAGGIMVEGSSVLTMSGAATIKGNESRGEGTEDGPVDGASDYGAGGGVKVNGSFTMSGGTISSNTAKGNGGGVFVGGTATFTKTGGTVYGYSDTSGNKNTATFGDGHAVYVNSNPAKKRNTTAEPTDKLNSGVAGAPGGWE